MEMTMSKKQHNVAMITFVEGSVPRTLCGAMHAQDIVERVAMKLACDPTATIHTFAENGEQVLRVQMEEGCPQFVLTSHARPAPCVARLYKDLQNKHATFRKLFWQFAGDVEEA
jgi:hypothetical protein